MKKARHTFTALNKLTISSFSKPSSLPQSLSSRSFYTLMWESSHEVPPLPLAQKFSVLPHSLGQSLNPCTYFCYIPPPTLCCSIHTYPLYIPPEHIIYSSPTSGLLFSLIVLPETPWNALYLCLSYPRFKAVFSFINLFLILKPCFLPCWKLISLSYWKKKKTYSTLTLDMHGLFPAHVYFLSIA